MSYASSEPLVRSPMSVCHFASGDVWAGAEAQVAALLKALKQFPDLKLSALLLNHGRLADELALLGIPLAVCEESRLGSPRLLLSVIRRLKEIQPVILHTHGYKEHLLSAAAGSFVRSPKLVQTYHGIMENLRGWAGIKMNLYERVNVAVGKLATDMIVGVSSEITRTLQQRFPSTEVRCIRNGVDLSHVVPTLGRAAMRERLGIAADVFVVGTVGRLMPIKGLEFLIEAFAQLREQHVPMRIQLVVVGDGPLREVLGQCAARRGVTNDMSFLGSRSDVYDLMAAFDVFVLPSLHEGIPMAILEAMAVGVPIVASRVGGIPEILEDGVEGLLVRSLDPPSLAAAIWKVARSPAVGVELSRAARIRVERDFSILSSAAQMRDMYQSLGNDDGYRD